jgi:hypothetical protein
MPNKDYVPKMGLLENCADVFVGNIMYKNVATDQEATIVYLFYKIIELEEKIKKLESKQN